MKRWGALLGVLLLAVACDSGPPRPVNVRFDLAWDTSGVKLESGHAAFTTDTGYEVELDRLTITTYSVELMPCEPLPQPQRAAFGFIGTAWAGHEAGHPPTRTNRAAFETPLTAATMAMDSLAVPDVAYCGAHYLIGRLLDPPPGAKPEDTVGFSLRAHGRTRRTGEEAWTDLTLDSSVAHGILVNFPEAKGGTHLKDGAVVQMTHKLAPLFNGVDFAVMDETAQVRQVLRQIVGGTVVSWRIGG